MLQSFPRFILTVLTCLFTCIQVLAQRPATGGAAPVIVPDPLTEEDDGLSPVVFIVGGAAIAGATYALVKSKGAKLPVGEHLPDYLLAHNILPNPDAIKLMYALNPSLNNMEEIRTKKKLNLPNFPDLDQSLSGDAPAENGESLAPELGREVTRFEISRQNLERVAVENSSNVALQNVARITATVDQRKQEISAVGLGNSATNTTILQMVFDLLSTFNQTLAQVVADKNASADQAALMQSIADNLTELLGDVKTFSQNGLANSNLAHRHLGNHENYLASIGIQDFLSVRPSQFTTGASGSVSGAVEEGLLREFAFAVYKFTEAGELITEGPEVEGKYKVKYVLPALKDIPNAYHALRDPATYAVASFPPAKIFIVVEDFSGNQVSIQDQLIDFKFVFNNPQLVNPDKKIVVPLYITR